MFGSGGDITDLFEGFLHSDRTFLVSNFKAYTKIWQNIALFDNRLTNRLVYFLVNYGNIVCIESNFFPCNYIESKAMIFETNEIKRC